MPPTPRQLAIYRAVERKFGRTQEWRAIARLANIEMMDAHPAYVFLGSLLDAVKHLRYERLSRSAGLPENADERRALYERALIEEDVARRECPDDERETWCADTRPPALGTGRPYVEQNPELLEALELDGYFGPARRG